jgi:glycosyltransferase involved in cell wall biosynthesis
MLVANEYEPDPRVHKEAKDLRKLGYSVSVISWDRQRRRRAFETIDGIRIKRFRYLDPHGFVSYAISGILFLLNCVGSLLADGVQGKKTVIHCHDFNTLPVGYLLRACFKERFRLVYDSHENFPALLQTIAPKFVALSVKAIERRMLDNVDGLITANDEILRVLHPPERIVSAAVFNAPPLSITEIPSRKSLEISILKRKFGKDCFVLTFPGRFQVHRGLNVVLDAAELLKDDKSRKVAFVLVGGGPLESELRREIQRRKLSEIVSIYPHLEFARVMRIVRSSDAIYIGYEPDDPNNHFASPHKLFEAMAMGVPVLASGYGYLGRFVRTTGCGVCLESIDGRSTVTGIRQLFDGQLRTRCGANGIRWFKSVYNWEVMTNRLASVYKVVTSHR